MGKEEDAKALPLFDPIQIRYDGLDAEQHEIDLYEFGKSAQGLAKIIATVADFAVTGNYQGDKRNLSCSVAIKETKANCFSFMAVVHAIDASPTLTAFVGGSGVIIFTAALKFIWCKITNDTEEMNAIKEALVKAIEELGRKDDSAKMLSTLETIALALIPAAKQAVSPIGNTCETIKFGDGEDYHTTLDREDKAVINGEDFSVTDEAEYRMLIDEFDMRKKTCKVALRDDLKVRYNARVTDPQAELANNKYALAMANKAIVTVKAKTKVFEAQIKEFVISDIEYDHS